MISFVELEGGGDPRGSSYLLDEAIENFLSDVKNCHVATIFPNQVRGNHFHKYKREIILIFGASRWKFFWDIGENTPIQRKYFSGERGVVVSIEPGASHAVVNSGDRVLTMVGLSDKKYDLSIPDAYRRVVAM